LGHLNLSMFLIPSPCWEGVLRSLRHSHFSMLQMSCPTRERIKDVLRCHIDYIYDQVIPYKAWVILIARAKLLVFKFGLKSKF